MAEQGTWTKCSVSKNMQGKSSILWEQPIISLTRALTNTVNTQIPNLTSAPVSERCYKTEREATAIAHIVLIISNYEISYQCRAGSMNSRMRNTDTTIEPSERHEWHSRWHAGTATGQSLKLYTGRKALPFQGWNDWWVGGRTGGVFPTRMTNRSHQDR